LRSRSSRLPKNIRRRKQVEKIIFSLAAMHGIPLQLQAKEIGRRLEYKVAKICEGLGYQVFDASLKQLRWDLLVNGFKVQCKARNSHGKNGYAINLLKNGTRPYTVEDVDFFVVFFDKKFFVLPVSEISDSSGNIFNWISLSDKQVYVDAWEQLRGKAVRRERQTSIWPVNG